MTSNYNDIVKQGYVRVKGGKVGLFKKKWLVLRKASSTGPCRMEKYVDEVSAKYGVNKKDVAVDRVRDIYRLPPDMKKFAFVTITSDNLSQHFATDSDVEADDWVNSLRKLLLIDQNSRTNEPDVVSSGLELNMKNIYHVCLLPSTKLDFHGECLIQVTSESIHLFDPDDPTKRLVTWPIRALRRYGQDSGKFTFETGRACETGDGMFGMASKDCDIIYNLVNDNAHAIATWLSQSNTPKRSIKPLSPDGSSNPDYYYGTTPTGKHKPPTGRPLPPPPPDTDG